MTGVLALFARCERRGKDEGRGRWEEQAAAEGRGNRSSEEFH